MEEVPPAQAIAEFDGAISEHLEKADIILLLVRVAFRRAGVEHCFRVCKSELGFTHYEGRSYTGLLRHLRLCWQPDSEIG